MKRFKWSPLAALVVALGLMQPVSAQTVKIALDTPADLKTSGSFVWVTAFSDHLKKNSMATEHFQRGALGGEAERLDQISQGLLEVSMSDVKSAGKLDKLIYGLYLPYFFDNLEQIQTALDKGGMLAKINAATTPKGVRVLAVDSIGLDIGIFNTKKAINTVSDMKGVRMRALDINQIALFESWGAAGTIVSWPEVPNALQTGVADGYVNPPFVPLMFGHTDFIKHYTDAGVSPSVRLAIASEDWYQGLSDAQRKTVNEAVALANSANAKWVNSRGGVLEKLTAAGVKVVKLSAAERAKFREASQAVYSKGALSEEQVQMWRDARAAK